LIVSALTAIREAQSTAIASLNFMTFPFRLWLPFAELKSLERNGSDEFLD
jgi:hypothetical protein